MIDGYFHIELNGVKYRLAEDAEGIHYTYEEQPLRPVNYAVVQGDNNRFQIRPDTLLWSWTDWSGGMGQLRFNQEEANRSMIIENMDPFTQPGKLLAGGVFSRTCDDYDDEDMTKNLVFVRGLGGMWALSDEATSNFFLWNPSNSDGTFNSGITVAPGGYVGTYPGGATADWNAIYAKSKSSADIIKVTTGPSGVAWNTDTGETGDNSPFVTVGDYVYLANPETMRVWEIPKSGSPPVDSTLIYDLSDQGGEVIDHGQGQFAVGDNRAYLMQVNEDNTVVHMITPSTAAAAGFGSVLDTYPGFKGEAIWYHLGFLYMVGILATRYSSSAQRAVLYRSTQGSEFGTLGYVRGDRFPGHNATLGSHYIPGGPAIPIEGASLLQSGFVLPTDGLPSANDGTRNFPSIFLVDAVSGGLAQVGTFDKLDTGNEGWTPGSALFYDREIFISTSADAQFDGFSQRTYASHPTAVADPGHTWVVSPSVDFGLSDEKVLSSVQISCEPMDQYWTIGVDAYLDGASTPINIGTYAEDGGTGTTFVVSTDTVTRSFRSLVLVLYTTQTAETPAPVILGVDVRATVAQRQPSWKLLLDVSDEHAQAQGRNLRGADLIDNLQAIGENVVAFKDGYQNKLPNTFEEFDVYVDSWTTILPRPGEGAAQVTLREVI